MLVTDLINVRYLSGFTGSNAALLVFADDDDAVLATDGRPYRTPGRPAGASILEVAIERVCGRYLAGRAAATGAQRVGFESHVVTVDNYDSGYAASAGRGRRHRVWSAPHRSWRHCARSKTPGRWRSCGWPAKPPTPRLPT